SGSSAPTKSGSRACMARGRMSGRVPLSTDRPVFRATPRRPPRLATRLSTRRTQSAMSGSLWRAVNTISASAGMAVPPLGQKKPELNGFGQPQKAYHGFDQDPPAGAQSGVDQAGPGR